MKKSGTRSKYNVDNSKVMCGMRVKLTYTFSAAGTMAPFFITVCGLSEREMPNDKFIKMKIKGLTVGGTGITVGTQKYGWLIFMRGEGGIDKVRYSIYRDKVFIPFVKDTRIDFGYWEEGQVIPDDLQAVSWCDGDLAQIDKIVDSDSLDIYKANRVCACKQNAARSATEQAADLAKTFKIMQRLRNIVTVCNVPFERHPLKRAINDELTKLASQDRLCLRAKNKNALVDFVGSIPQMSTQACTHDNIHHGFRENGMSDRLFKRYPDFYDLLATCRLDPTNEEMNICKNSFHHLFELYLQHGHVPDSVFEDLGFPLDKDVDGTTTKRLANISMESRQRAKVLTHKHQVELREERKALLESEVTRKKNENRATILKQLGDNIKCEERMCTLMGVEHSADNLNGMTMEIIEQLYAYELKPFILVRDLDVVKSRLPKKGSAVEAHSGEKNLVSMCYDLKNSTNLLQNKLDELDKNESATNIEVAHQDLLIEDVELHMDKISILKRHLNC